MSHQDRAVFGKFLKILGVLIIISVVFYFIAGEITHDKTEGDTVTLAVEKLANDNIRPVGQVRIAGEKDTGQVEEPPAASAEVPAPITIPPAATARSGEQIYNGTCAACHNSGAAGAPMLEDKAAWESRVARGADSMLQNVITGLNAMPPKGLCMDCSDDDLKAAIQYMLSSNQ